MIQLAQSAKRAYSLTFGDDGTTAARTTTLEESVLGFPLGPAALAYESESEGDGRAPGRKE